MSNSDSSQTIKHDQDSRVVRGHLVELSTIPLNTIVAVGGRKKLVRTIVFIGGLVFIAVISAVVLIVIKNRSKETRNETTATTLLTTVTTPNGVQVNLVINGDAETGPCATDGSLMSPTDWNYNGTATQVTYIGSLMSGVFLSNSVPKKYGRCFFYGHQSPLTSIWQRINLTNFPDFLIGNQVLRFKLSAWIGGYGDQDDHASISLIFLNETMHKLDKVATIGPVFASDRKDQSKFLFRNATGFVPDGTYFLEIYVRFTAADGTYNDGYVDNIALILY